MFVYPTVSSVLVNTPAKINLFLEVIARRADGFHEIETLMAAVTIFDTVEFAPRRDGELRLRCRWVGGMQARIQRRPAAPRADESPASQPFGDIPQGPQNIVYRAVARLRDQTAASSCGADICVTKRIPSAAGLGGASSDAAAALVAANVAWGLHWPPARLAELAAEIGSDVPFFFRGGWAVCRGRGERTTPSRGGPLHLVVVRPATGLGTAQVYGQCRPAVRPRNVAPLESSLAIGNWRAIRRMMTNRLEEAAGGLNPSIVAIKERLHRLGSVAEQMSGSGSSCFGVCRSARHARRMAAQARALRVGEVYQATMSSRGGGGIASGEGDVNSAS